MHRKVCRALRSAGIHIPAQRWIWAEETDRDEWCSEFEPEYSIYLAFNAPVSLTDTLLWCALSKELPPIEPRPLCDVYLFSLKKSILVFPYDDRGMDVVGPNGEFLSTLYETHQAYLLDYDRASMDKTFSKAPDLR